MTAASRWGQPIRTVVQPARIPTATPQATSFTSRWLSWQPEGAQVPASDHRPLPPPSTDRTDKSASPPPSVSSVGSQDDTIPQRYLDLIRDARAGRLAYPARLESPWPGLEGMVTNLGEWVLAWSEALTRGGDREHVLARLEAAYTARQ